MLSSVSLLFWNINASNDENGASQLKFLAFFVFVSF